MALFPLLYLRTYTILTGETLYSTSSRDKTIQKFSVSYVMQMDMTHRSGDCYFFNQRKSGVGLRVGSCVNIQSGYIRYQNTGNGLRHQRGYKAAKS